MALSGCPAGNSSCRSWFSLRRVRIGGRQSPLEKPTPASTERRSNMDINNLDLTDRRGIITGAGQGIGRAIALEFGRRGGHLLLVGRQLATLTETGRLVAAAGGTTEILVEDLTKPGAVERIAHTVASWNTVDLLVNNAGNVRAGRLELTSDADVHSMIDLNLTAPILLTKALLPALRESGQQRGSILLNVSSGIALVGMPFYSIYAATKSGLAQFGESLRRELTGTGVHVATVYPGATDTDMMRSQNAGTELGWGRRSLADVITDLITALQAGEHEINTAPEGRRAMQDLNRTDPMAVDAALAPGLEDLELAVRDHRSI
ncbi:SDR family NAD(P)-dependent oxidoreductase [Cryobacterium glaciale]|uniref:SDR family NAD(P)-dependent oxidoreductase n=2 Tax=Cryobacterium glaciale TaxID=1259145 RepID=A0A4R8UNE3_9MICO|nr:SDR family NAD(P)-dependent oxidoreductase [Cryobacterium glaciale]